MVPLGTAALTYGEHRIMRTPGGAGDTADTGGSDDTGGSGGIGGSGGWWGRKSTPGKVEAYTRWSFHFFALIEATAVGLPAFAQTGAGTASRLAVAVAGHAVLCSRVSAQALDWTRGRREQPVRLLWALGAVTALIAAVALVLRERGSGGEDLRAAASTVFVGVLGFGAGTLTLGLRGRRQVLNVVAGCVAGALFAQFALGSTAGATLGTGLAVLFTAGGLAFTAAFSVWLLDAVYELDEARETRARLAVAEERLRFGRDLHDVMGRNLSVIALKSELAVQLARRGRAEAVEQMIEVQRIARESQREVRDVVRGYREAALDVELAGAQGVLTAAGIECEVTGEAAGLPAEVQSALGWVVREATTNVLRHGNAGRCAVAVRVAAGSVVLTVENDGAKTVDGGTGGGAGLVGLRERLTAVGGELEAGSVDGERFRVVATVPLPAVAGGVAS
ncbi:histidine kinase [Streptomyces sp. W16]|uniref:sensor histidine kinase n=1 Tax=Streptomyces sp. W16 TaxID=3076631 RepID=UPI00295C05F9|nr:histidine kinase [Streptomyces sp. W16]MDV9173315.1 histidine kinase [Streptomyces sp. W16]